MNPVFRGALIGVTLIASAAAPRGSSGPLVPVAGPSRGARGNATSLRPPSSAEPRPLKLDSILRMMEARAPFRADRRPPPTRFASGSTTTPAAPPSPRPQLLLQGIIWGDEPAIVLDGLPGGTPQHLLYRGDSVAGLRVVRITTSTAVVKGLDTTWVLSLRSHDR
jgi:hypothetical protein